MRLKAELGLAACKLAFGLGVYGANDEGLSFWFRLGVVYFMSLLPAVRHRHAEGDLKILALSYDEPKAPQPIL